MVRRMAVSDVAQGSILFPASALNFKDSSFFRLMNPFVLHVFPTMHCGVSRRLPMFARQGIETDGMIKTCFRLLSCLGLLRL